MELYGKKYMNCTLVLIPKCMYGLASVELKNMTELKTAILEDWGNIDVTDLQGLAKECHIVYFKSCLCRSTLVAVFRRYAHLSRSLIIH